MSWEIKKKFNDFEVSRQISPLKQITMVSKNETTQTVTNSHTMAQQTAVEWLVDKLIKGEFINNPDELIDQAKAMEKEHIEKAKSDGYDVAMSDAIKEIHKNYKPI